jgi:hypothetical protein
MPKMPHALRMVQEGEATFGSFTNLGDESPTTVTRHRAVPLICREDKSRHIPAIRVISAVP